LGGTAAPGKEIHASTKSKRACNNLLTPLLPAAYDRGCGRVWWLLWLLLPLYLLFNYLCLIWRIDPSDNALDSTTLASGRQVVIIVQTPQPVQVHAGSGSKSHFPVTVPVSTGECSVVSGQHAVWVERVDEEAEVAAAIEAMAQAEVDEQAL